MKALVAGGLAVIAAFSAGIGVGWKFLGYPRGYDLGYLEGAKAKQIELDALWTTSVRITGEREQCKTQIVKVNTEVDRQKEENRQLLTVDRVATQEAIARAERAAIAAASSSAKTQIQLAEAAHEMGKIKDACINAGVPAAVFDVLNRSLSRANAD